MDKYENLGLVGEGSYGIVMKCRHKATGTLVAIKKFLESEDDKIVRRIANREIKMLKQLRHENLVNLIDLFKRKKKLFLVFEFVDYTLLDDLEKNPSGLEHNYARRILFQVLRGIEFCHHRDVIHRDIKPENILVSKSGIVKLCDFGFARPLSGQSNSFTDYVATRWYRAPELLVGDTKYGKPVDIWAIGCLASEMYAGDPLFPGDSDIDQLFHIVKCIGYICQKHIEIFKKNALFKGLQIPESSSKYSLEKRYPKMIKDVIIFIRKCLDPTPEVRPTCSQLLAFDLFPERFSESLISEIRLKVQKEREKNPLIKNSVISQSPSISRHENNSVDSSPNKVNINRSSNSIKSNINLSKGHVGYNYQISKLHDNNQITNNNNNNNNNFVSKNENSLNNQENEIGSENKNIVVVDEEEWEDVRPLTSRKERVASRAGRYPTKTDELISKEARVNDSPELMTIDINVRNEVHEISKRIHTITNKDPYSKAGVHSNNQFPIYIKQDISNKMNLTPRSLDTPLQEVLNKPSKPTQPAFIQIKNNDNVKRHTERSPLIDAPINRASPTQNEITQTYSQHFATNSKKNINAINNSSINGNSSLTSKTQINTYSSIHQQLNSNIPFTNYPVKQTISNVQQRHFGFPTDNMVHSYLPNIGKESKYRQTNTYYHGISSPNKPFVPQTTGNVYKSTGPLVNERSGFYFNTQNKRKPLITTRPNPTSYQDHNISLPELKGAEMPIIRNQAYITNSKYKYLIPKTNFNQNDPLGNNIIVDNIATQEP